MTPIQLDLVRTFGPKELSEGCLLQNNFSDKHEPYTFRRKVGNKYIFFSKQFNREMEFNMNGGMTFESTFTILGHIPNIGDIHNWMNKNTNGFSQISESDYNYIKPKNRPKSECIEYNSYISLIDQEDSTLVQLLNLFK